MKPDQIKQIRHQLKMSQQAFASALGVSFATVNRWENDKAKPQRAPSKADQYAACMAEHGYLAAK